MYRDYFVFVCFVRNDYQQFIYKVIFYLFCDKLTNVSFIFLFGECDELGPNVFQL